MSRSNRIGLSHDPSFPHDGRALNLKQVRKHLNVARVEATGWDFGLGICFHEAYQSIHVALIPVSNKE